MGQETNSLITGLASALTGYLDFGNKTAIQGRMEAAKSARELENSKTLKQFESDLSLKNSQDLEAWKAKVEDVKKRGQNVQLGQLLEDPEFGGLAALAPNAVIEAKDLLDYRLKKDKAGQEKAPKEHQYKAGRYFQLAESAENALGGLEKRMDLGSWGPIGRAEGFGNDRIGEGAIDLVRGQDWKQFMGARKSIAEAYLRPATGATINKDEYANIDKIFIPVPGDSKNVQAKKKANRKGLRAALVAEAEGKTVDLSVFEPVTEENAGGNASNDGWSYVGPVGK